MKIKGLCHAIVRLSSIALVPLAIAQTLPDLTITDLTVNNKCEIVVTIKNNGPGQLPASAFSTGSKPSLQLYKDNASYGFWSMGVPELKNPGGTHVYVVLAANKTVSGTQNIRAVIDDGNVVTEANENNNSMQKTLTCTPKLPDLVIEKIDFGPDCRTMISIKNIGDGEILANYFNGVNVTRTIDGQSKGWFRLSEADPSGAVRLPGGQVVWTDFAEFKAKTGVNYQMSNLPGEKSTTNNTGIANIPSRCTQDASKRKTTAPVTLPGTIRK